MSIDETAEVIAVPRPHRTAAFEACEHLVDDLPISKLETTEEGSAWLAVSQRAFNWKEAGQDT